jgi:hypothetical protein
VNSLGPVGMLYTGMISPLFLAPFYFYQAKYMQSVWDFKQNEASVNSSKKLKKSSYMPFMVLLAGFMLSTAYNRSVKRKENVEIT